jgi:sulfonate dioxygenase
MAQPTLKVDGKSVDSISEVKPTVLDFPATGSLPSLKQRVLPIRPLGDHIPPQVPRLPVEVREDRGLVADPDLLHLLGAAGVERIDLTPSIGTLLKGLQLSQLTDLQKDELALLVSHRGVVFFRDQDITSEGQRELFNYYGVPEEFNPEEDKSKEGRIFVIEEQEQDFRAAYVHFKWPFADFHADSTFQANPPSFSMLRIHTTPPTGGDTSW